jgi:hypothetical protein
LLSRSWLIIHHLHIRIREQVNHLLSLVVADRKGAINVIELEYPIIALNPEPDIAAGF